MQTHEHVYGLLAKNWSIGVLFVRCDFMSVLIGELFQGMVGECWDKQSKASQGWGELLVSCQVADDC
jgi:hypothetical protein